MQGNKASAELLYRSFGFLKTLICLFFYPLFSLFSLESLAMLVEHVGPSAPP